MEIRYHPRSSAVYLGVWLLLSLLYNDILLLVIMFCPLVWLNYQLDRARSFMKMARFAVPIILFIVVLNSLLNQTPGEVLWQFQGLPLAGQVYIYKAAVYYGVMMSVKLLLVLAIFTAANLVLPAEKILDIFGAYSGPTAVLVAITWGVIPQLTRRAASIGEIQSLRGVDFSGSLLHRVKSFGFFLTNLVRSSLEQSLQMAEVMHLKGYGSGERTVYIQQEWEAKEWKLTILAVIVLLMALTSFTLGYFRPIQAAAGLNYPYPLEVLLTIILSLPIFIRGDGFK